MITTKKALIKKLNDIGELKIKQGCLFKELSLSINQYQDQKTLKEWKKLVNHKLGIIEKEVQK